LLTFETQGKWKSTFLIEKWSLGRGESGVVVVVCWPTSGANNVFVWILL
jgi:hypothetical protein